MLVAHAFYLGPGLDTLGLIGCLAFGLVLLGLTLLQIRGLGQRLAGLERGQIDDRHGIAQAVVGIQTDLARARDGLIQVQTYAVARQDLERRTADSIRRLELVIAGTQSKGSGGENLLEPVLAQLPADWQVRDFRVADKPVEFGVRLPNGRVLPIDCKWPGTRLLEEFATCDDSVRRQRLKDALEQTTLARAAEVRKYLDPHRTVGFAIVAVPDAVFDLLYRAQVEALKLDVVLLGNSMVLPYVLLVVHTIGQNAHSIDLEQVSAWLSTAESAVRSLQEELDGRFARAMTMLTNARSDMGAQLGRLHIGLTSARLSAGSEAAPEREDRTAPWLSGQQ